MISKIFKRVLKHKIMAGITLAVIVAGGYFIYQGLAGDNNLTQYVTAAVEKGTLIVSVSGSGQVSASDQVDIKPKVSGDIVYLGVENGQEVKKGTIILQLDTADAKKAIEEADISLETAIIDLEDLQSPPDELSLLQSQNSLIQAQESKQKAEDSLEKGYKDAFSEISSVFLDLPSIATGLKNTLYGYDMSALNTQDNLSIYQNSISSEDRIKLEPFTSGAEYDYGKAKNKYDKTLADYKSASRYSDKETIESLLDDVIETVTFMSDTARSGLNLIDYVVDYLSDRDARINDKMTEHQTNLKTYISKLNSDLSGLLSAQKSIEDNKNSIISADRSIKEKQLSFDKLTSGPTELELRTKQLAVQQKEDVLAQAKQNLADCYVYAPFDGVVSDLKVSKGDSVSLSTAAVNMITKQRIIDILLNEVDAAKVKVGQKATLTFDALPDLSISGQVLGIDVVGTVAQGVVSYGVKISLDVQNEDIKPGMTATADIITDIKQNALILPNSAIKSQGNSYYVEIVQAPENTRQQFIGNVSAAIVSQSLITQTVEIGISNDTSTEIISGIQEGDIVVSSTINQSTSAQSSQTRSSGGFQIQGGNRALIKD